MMMLVGLMEIVQGLVALLNDEFFVAPSEWVFEFDVTAWGWILLISGVVLVAAGIGIFFGDVLARAGPSLTPATPPATGEATRIRRMRLAIGIGGAGLASPSPRTGFT